MLGTGDATSELAKIYICEIPLLLLWEKGECARPDDQNGAVYGLTEKFYNL